MDLTDFNSNYLKKLLENISKKQNFIFPLRGFNVYLLNYDEHNPTNELQGFKKRFMKDENFFKNYSNFMEDLFWKGYAEKSPNVSDGNKWYIPHHGLYHPARPKKIRVVFDCSAEYLGYALNKQLIPGPDLTNQIVGVLIRFREEQDAFMGDIEAMFYQVGIPKCQWSML